MKDIELYPFNENEAKVILEKIKELKLEYNIDLEDIKRNYREYRVLQEQDKINFLKFKDNDIPMDAFLKIIVILSKSDVDYFYQHKFVPKNIIVSAIYNLGINKFNELKAQDNLEGLWDINNYKKMAESMNRDEKNLFKKFRRNSIQNTLEEFYLFYYAIKHYTEEELDMLLQVNIDEEEYINKRIYAKNSGYIWLQNIGFLTQGTKMSLFSDKRTNKRLLMDIRKSLNIPLNIISTAIIDLELYPYGKEIDEKDFKKIVFNYHKFNLNVINEKDKEQVKKVLLSLPDDISTEYEPVIKECLIGRLKRFKLDTFEQIKDYKNVCEERILQEIQNENDVKKIKEIICESKFKDWDIVKRDLYYYKKYKPQDAESNKIFKAFNRLLNSQDKEEVMTIYQKLNVMNEEFWLDSAIDEIKQELIEISKQDIITQMKKMQEKIENAQEKHEKNIIDITGTDFNLFISVIGGKGSPYLKQYANKILMKLEQYKDNEPLYPILYTKAMLKIKRGQKKLVKERYRLDPLKNKQRCVSSIDQDFIGHIKSYFSNKKNTKEKLILAYFPQKEEDISYMGNRDLMSIYDKDRNDETRKRVPHKDNMNYICSLKLKDLNASTIGDDNEVIINSYPGAVMCFDVISKVSRKTSEKLGIPILFLDSKRQFEIMKNRLYEYYVKILEQVLECQSVSEELFEKSFNTIELDNNIIHRAFKMANSFTYLDDDEFPKNQIIEIFKNMSELVKEFFRRCSQGQREVIREIMLKEADTNNLRYYYYKEFVNFEELHKIVLDKDVNQETELDK